MFQISLALVIFRIIAFELAADMAVRAIESQEVDSENIYNLFEQGKVVFYILAAILAVVASVVA